MLLKTNGSDHIEAQQTQVRGAMSESPGTHGPPDQAAKIAVFGPFELNLATGELCKAGARVRLQNKPFQILRALIQQSGEVVTREQLRRHVWPDDTFVDFESGLNTAANRLRLALNDSAENPRYIETLPRIGYRFMAAVQFQTKSTPPQSVEQETLDGSQAARVAVNRKLPRPTGLMFSSISVAVLLVAGFLLVRHSKSYATPVFHQLTFRQGGIDNARFTPSGEVVFSAGWDDGSNHLYIMNPASPEARELPFGAARLVSVSPSSEISFLRKVVSERNAVSELAVAPLYGGAPRVVTRDVQLADISAHGEISIVRKNSGGYVLESPPGQVLYQTSAWLSRPRVSPDGSMVAVAEHPLQDDDSGFVLLVDRHGNRRHLSDGWASLGGVVWSPRGDEVWFSAAKHGINRELYAVNLRSRVRRVAGIPATLDLFDIAPSGTVLIGRSTPRLSMMIGDIKTLSTKDVSWLDWSRAAALSADGNELLFDETGEGGGPAYTVYLRRRDRGTVERIGPGHALDLSRDGQWILTSPREPSSTISLISAEDAKTKTISAPGQLYQSAYFLGNSRNILVQLSEVSGRTQRVFVQNMDTGALREVKSSATLGHLVVSPAGTVFATRVSEKEIRIVHLPDGQQFVIDTDEPTAPVSWVNENTMLVARRNGERIQLDQLDVTTNKRRLWLQLPADIRPEMRETMPVMLSADLSTFAFSWLDHGENLFTATGWS